MRCRPLPLWTSILGLWIAGTLLLIGAPPAACAARVRISPARVRLSTGESTRFSARVEGSSDPRVLWSVDGGRANGTISEDGLYTAPDSLATPAQITIRARGLLDPTRSAAAVIQLENVQLAVRPAQATVRLGEECRFEARVEGTANKAVQWSVQGRENGAISANGRYVPPPRLATPATITIVATSVADPSKRATARVTVPEVTLLISPGGAPSERRRPSIGAKVYGVVQLSLPLDPVDALVHAPLFRGRSGKLYVPAGGVYQFRAKLSNTVNPDVAWSVEGGDANGRISPDGLYETPDRMETPRVVQIHAQSVADPSRRATVVIHIPPVRVETRKEQADVRLGAAVPFEAEVHNSDDRRIEWSVEGGDGSGTISSAGLYRPPPSLTTPATLHLRATSVVDPTKFARITIRIPAVSLEVRPDRAALRAGETLHLRPRITGSDDLRVHWELNPPLGSLRETGDYRAPDHLERATTVRVLCASAADPTKQAIVEIRLKPGRK